MNIGCCIRDPILCARLADLLSQEGFDCELFKHESAIVRTLRHRGGIDLLLDDAGDQTRDQAIGAVRDGAGCSP